MEGFRLFLLPSSTQQSTYRMLSLSIANRAYVLETGRIVNEGDAHALLDDESIKKAYLGE